MTDSSTYTPAVGDHIVMPRTPATAEWDQNRSYIVDALPESAVRLKSGDDTWTLPAEWTIEWGIHRVYTHTEVTQAVSRAVDMVSGVTEDGGEDAEGMTSDALDRLDDPQYGRNWRTRDEVSGALNEAANFAHDEENSAFGENSETIAADSSRDLAVNAALYLLDHPDADLHDVITTQYADIDVDEGELPEGSVKGDDEWNDAIYETVKGWIS